jgi:hypothetical protein
MVVLPSSAGNCKPQIPNPKWRHNQNVRNAIGRDFSGESEGNTKVEWK